MDNTGIFGLAPKSSLFDYLYSQYTFKHNRIGITLKIDAGDEENVTDLFEGTKSGLFQGSELVFSDTLVNLHGRNQRTKLRVENLNQDYWTIPKVTVRLSGSDYLIHENVEACLAITDNHAIGSSKFGEIMELVSKALC